MERKIYKDISQRNIFFRLCTSDFRKIIKCVYQLPKVHLNFYYKTVWSNFLVKPFERLCCLNMPPHLTLKQCFVCNKPGAHVYYLLIMRGYFGFQPTITMGIQKSCFYTLGLLSQGGFTGLTSLQLDPADRTRSLKNL